MKLRKILTIVLIVLIIFTTMSFASTRINTNSAISNSVNNEIPEEDLIPALEAKLNENKNSNKNAISDKPNSSVTNKNQNTTIGKPNSSTAGNKVINGKEEILDDIYKATDELLEYNNVSIKGNVYILSNNNVSIKDTEIYGNLFIITENLEFNNTVVNGSIYVIATSSMNIIGSDITSAYVMGETVNIDEDTKIDTDLRASGDRVYISGYIGRNAYVSSEFLNITDEAKIAQKCDVSAKEYEVPENIRVSDKFTISDYKFEAPTLEELLPELLTEFAIILVISIFVLGGAPKFTEVNLKLSRIEFVKAFFTGIIELVVIFAAAIGIMIWGFGIGYSVALLTLTFTILGLGKVIFILAYSIRMIRKARRTSRRKAFVAEVFVALAVQAIGLIAMLGERGYAISVLIDLILGVVGFGTLVRVILTPRPKAPKKEKEERDLEDKEPIKEKVETIAPVSTNVEPQMPRFENGSIIVQAKEVRIENVGKIEIIDKKEEPVAVAEEPKINIESKSAVETKEESDTKSTVEEKEVAPENENIENNSTNNDDEDNSNKD